MADFDYKKMRDYVSADPEVSKLREKRTLSYKRIDTLKQSARENIEKMHGLYLAKTAVMEKVQYEPAGESADEVLEEITGQCSDCWNSDWTNSLDVIFDGQLGCSLVIANLGKQIHKLSEDIQLINGCLDTLETELQKQFREQFYKDQQTNTEVEL